MDYRRDRRFFTFVALGLIALVFTGFFRTFYFSPLFLPEPLPVLLIAHGTVMTAWYGLFLLQVRLAGRGRLELHRRLGYASLGLAALVVALGLQVSVGLARERLARNPQSAEGPFLLGVQIFCILLPFLVLYGTGMLNRRRPEVHKRLMALAMFATVGPAVVRLPFLPNHNVPVGIAVSLGLVLAFLAGDWVTSRKLHRVTALGVGLIIVSTFAGAAFSGTGLWVGLVRRLLA
jgi:hypothetical protein